MSEVAEKEESNSGLILNLGEVAVQEEVTLA
jgi:hypothetical protein